MISKRVTIYDIARQLGISPSTVTRAINGKAGVSDELRARIVETAAQMGYRTNRIAKSLTRDTMRIAVVVIDRMASFHPVILEGARRAAEELADFNVEGEYVLLSRENLRHNTIAELNRLADEGVKGIIFTPNPHYRFDEIIAELTRRGVAVGTVISPSENPDITVSVSLDGIRAGRLAADLFHVNGLQWGDEVLVQVAYCGICATDYDNFRGETSFAKNGDLKYPLRFGHEWSGVVREVGCDVKDFAPGDKVIGDGKVTCTVCENCRAGRWYDCLNIRAVGTVKNHWPGGMAEYILMPARNVFKVADHVSLKEAALCEPVTIAMNGMRETDLTGKTVLVIGSGPIGMGGVTAAKVMGAKRIICAARKQNKLQRAMEMGATDVINTAETNIYEELLKITGGRKADFVLETSGCAEYVEHMLDLVINMGTMSLVGFYDRPLSGFNLDNFAFAKVTLRGSSGAREYTPIVLGLLNEGKIRLLP
ncbi:MAG: alcohol dehydrogenase catalytic domain-containing protein, partial [Clostridia bacterium]|nr:alcohol dehydrogenase catalytic domain-containing protein [Clostridia bacterium]